MEKFTVQRDNARDLSFTGELLAKVSSSPDTAMGSSYSGGTGRWQVLSLYRTKSGKFICQRIDKTQWQGERDSYSAAVCGDYNQVVDFFGGGWLAKDLYEEAGVIAQEEIE